MRSPLSYSAAGAMTPERSAPPLVAPAIFLVSLGVLLIEISLTRIFSFTLWYHFSYVAISIALLGSGASGALLAASRSLASLPPRGLTSSACLLGAAASVVALLAIRFVPFQPFELASDRWQWGIMGIRRRSPTRRTARPISRTG
jgi:hypothetical protein